MDKKLSFVFYKTYFEVVGEVGNIFKCISHRNSTE